MKYWIKNNYLWKYWSSVHQTKMFITKETKWHLFCCCHDNSFAASPVLIKPEILSLCLTQRPSTPANLIMFQARLSVSLLKGWKSGYLVSGYLILRIWLFIKPLKPNESRNNLLTWDSIFPMLNLCWGPIVQFVSRWLPIMSTTI